MLKANKRTSTSSADHKQNAEYLCFTIHCKSESKLMPTSSKRCRTWRITITVLLSWIIATTSRPVSLCDSETMLFCASCVLLLPQFTNFGRYPLQICKHVWQPVLKTGVRTLHAPPPPQRTKRTCPHAVFNTSDNPIPILKWKRRMYTVSGS